MKKVKANYKPMTLQEAKDQVAKEYGYENWWGIDFTNVSEEVARDKAAELYARAKWDECYQILHDKYTRTS